MPQTKTVVTIKLVSDFICPWCLIGEKRLSDAIAQLPENIEVNVRWSPFELNPQMPKEGMNRRTYRSAKFGSWERSRELDAGTTEAGKPDGVDFNYDLIERTPNTFAAHKLTYWADLFGKQTDMAHRILSTYFTKGEDIGDQNVLAKIAGDVGLDPDAAARYLADKDTDDAVLGLMKETLAAGITGVPHFEIEGVTVRGAQSAATLADALRTAAARTKPDGLDRF